MTDCFKGSFLLLVLIIAQVQSQECPQPCQCPADVPACQTGVSLVRDGCGCCQVCARQRGEQCTKLNPCDSGLQCDHSASLPGEPGECVGLEEVGCELNDVLYAEGQTFRPSCDSLCRCSGGGVSCVRTCPVSSPLPSTDCPNPQYLRLPGTCCPQWVCENLDNTILKDAITAQQSGRLRPSLPWTPVNRLGPVRPPPPPRPVCVEQSTQWSACSQSCGPGVSTRVSNQNPSCRLQLETRLCKVRPCSPHLPQRTAPGQWSHSGECQPTVLSPGRVRLLHEDCSSTRTFQLRFCGLCSDSRCCTPHHTSTAQVGFICPGGRRQKRAVMLIHSCACHQNCPYAPHKNPALWGFRP